MRKQFIIKKGEVSPCGRTLLRPTPSPRGYAPKTPHPFPACGLCYRHNRTAASRFAACPLSARVPPPQRPRRCLWDGFYSETALMALENFAGIPLAEEITLTENSGQVPPLPELRALTLSQTAFTNGLITQLSVTEAANRLDKASLGLQSAVCEYRLAFYDWEAASGSAD